MPWVTAPNGLTLPPIGTFRQANPTTGTRLLAAPLAADEYKIEEIREAPESHSSLLCT